MYTHVLDNFDNSITKDWVDHEVNVTHRHDWPNKNASVPKSSSGKRKDFIYLRPHLANHPPPPLPLSTFDHFCLTPLLSPPLMCGHPLWMAPLSFLDSEEESRSPLLETQHGIVIILHNRKIPKDFYLCAT